MFCKVGTPLRWLILVAKFPNKTLLQPFLKLKWFISLHWTISFVTQVQRRRTRPKRYQPFEPKKICKCSIETRQKIVEQ